MICVACRERRHGECRGGTWCDCQHKPPAGKHSGKRPADQAPETTPGQTTRPDQTDEPDVEDGPEPGINWLRQG